jgi:dihydroflavonol-4-reductase
MAFVLVTGGSGFIGRSLVSALVARGRQVRVFDLHPPRISDAGMQFVQGSILDPAAVRRALDDVDEVYHLAALPGMWLADKAEFDQVNFRGTETVVAAAQERGVVRFLHCSTESILFRNPPLDDSQPNGSPRTLKDMPGPYTRSKFAAEQLALRAAASGFPLVVASPTMPIGLHDENLTPPTAMLRHFLGGGLRFYLDFIVNLVDVRDLAVGLILAMERGQPGHRYVLGGESIALKDILRRVAAISGRRTFFLPVPAHIATSLTGLLEFVSDNITRQPPAGTVEGVRIALRACALSSEKARRELGYSPSPIDQALTATIEDLLGRSHRQGLIPSRDRN